MGYLIETLAGKKKIKNLGQNATNTMLIYKV